MTQDLRPCSKPPQSALLGLQLASCTYTKAHIWLCLHETLSYMMEHDYMIRIAYFQQFLDLD